MPIIGFTKATIKELLLTPSGGLSLPKIIALIASGAATYKFIVADTNDPMIWLVYLGVVGGHAGASKLLSTWVGKKDVQEPS